MSCEKRRNSVRASGECKRSRSDSMVAIFKCRFYCLIVLLVAKFDLFVELHVRAVECRNRESDKNRLLVKRWWLAYIKGNREKHGRYSPITT